MSANNRPMSLLLPPPPNSTDGGLDQSCPPYMESVAETCFGSKMSSISSPMPQSDETPYPVSNSYSYTHQEANKYLEDNPEENNDDVMMVNGAQTFVQPDSNVNGLKYPKKSNFFLKNWNRQQKKQKHNPRDIFDFTPQVSSSKSVESRESKTVRKVKKDVWFHTGEVYGYDDGVNSNAEYQGKDLGESLQVIGSSDHQPKLTTGKYE